MGKILTFIYNDMADFEITFTCSMLNLNIDHKILPVAYTKDPVKASSNMVYSPVMTVSEALELDDIEGIIIPGGWNQEQRPELAELIRRVYESGKLTAAICAGPVFLAKAGILDGRKYTTTLSAENFVKENKEDPFPRDTFIKEKVVRDGNIITAVGNAFIDFGAEIFDFYKLFEDDNEKEQFKNEFK